MGLYDTLRCHYPLPVAGANALEFQTKSTPAQFCDDYEIRIDGTLWHQAYNLEDRSDPLATGLGRLTGMATRVNLRWEPEPMSGELRFYAHQEGQWLAFLAEMVSGQLVALTPTAPPPAGTPATLGAKDCNAKLIYKRSQGVDAFLKQVHEATPIQLMNFERQGVAGAFITDLAKRMDLPTPQLFAMLSIPPAVAARKSAAGAMVDGQPGQAAINLIKLLCLAQEIVEDSTAPEAKDFDTVKWLGQWVVRPQPALGGCKPVDYLDTPTGLKIVEETLGAIRSGAYL